MLDAQLTILRPIKSNIGDDIDKVQFLFKDCYSCSVFTFQNHRMHCSFVNQVIKAQALNKRAQRLLDWLGRIGVAHCLQQSWEASAYAEVLGHSCKDGVMLAALLCKLESIRLPGISWNPTAGAAKVHNITKVLRVLRQRSNMKLQHLWSERDIVHGNPFVCVELLEHIHDAYHQKSVGTKRTTPHRIYN